MCPVHRALLASSAPEAVLAKMEVFSRSPKATAAVHRAGWYEGWNCVHGVGIPKRITRVALDRAVRQDFFEMDSQDPGEV